MSNGRQGTAFGDNNEGSLWTERRCAGTVRDDISAPFIQCIYGNYDSCLTIPPVVAIKCSKQSPLNPLKQQMSQHDPEAQELEHWPVERLCRALSKGWELPPTLSSKNDSTGTCYHLSSASETTRDYSIEIDAFLGSRSTQGKSNCST